MIEEPRCSIRQCSRFLGVKVSGNDELTERVVCEAYPNGIPEAIAYGDNPHTKPYPGDNGIRFEPIETERGE